MARTELSEGRFKLSNHSHELGTVDLSSLGTAQGKVPSCAHTIATWASRLGLVLVLLAVRRVPASALSPRGLRVPCALRGGSAEPQRRPAMADTGDKKAAARR